MILLLKKVLTIACKKAPSFMSVLFYVYLVQIDILQFKLDPTQLPDNVDI